MSFGAELSWACFDRRGGFRMQRIPGDIPGDGGRGIGGLNRSRCHTQKAVLGDREHSLVILNLKIECCSFCGVALLFFFFFLVVLKLGVAKIEQLH